LVACCVAWVAQSLEFALPRTSAGLAPPLPAGNIHGRVGRLVAPTGGVPELLPERHHLLLFRSRLGVGTPNKWRQTIPLILGMLLGWNLLRSQGSVQAAVLASGQTETHLHLGQRLALMLKSTLRLPDWAILMALSALPLVELRGGIPVGLWMGMPVLQVMLLCIAGNMIPIPLMILALRLPKVKRLFDPLLRRAETKLKAIGAHDRWIGVAAFVGVPLPGTGAWTGGMIAFLLGMELHEALTSVLAGVCIAACIMASLVLAGWWGCGVAVCTLAVALVSRYLRSR